MKNMLNKIEIELNTFTHTHTNKCIKWHWSESFESFIHNRTFNVLFCFSTNTRKWFAQELLQFYYQFTTYLKKNWFYILRINVSCFNNISITFCCYEVKKERTSTKYTSEMLYRSVFLLNHNSLSPISNS